MKMSEVKVGMQFEMDSFNGSRTIIVRQITKNGFIYDYLDGQTINLGHGQSLCPQGHEHYGVLGEVYGMELIPQTELGL